MPLRVMTSAAGDGPAARLSVYVSAALEQILPGEGLANLNLLLLGAMRIDSPALKRTIRAALASVPCMHITDASTNPWIISAPVR